MSDEHIILGIHVSDRLKNAVEVQKVFTEYGCNIKTRIGLHDVDADVCSPSGVVLIEFFGTTDEAEAMAAKVGAVEGVDVQTMVFGH
jgi:hypothetical protein